MNFLHKFAFRNLSRADTAIRPTFSVAAGAAIIAALVFVAYFPAINGRFILDDEILLTESRFIRAQDGLYQFWCTNEADDYWPLTNASFWMEWRLWEMNSAGYHVTNLILHAVESLLIWLILRKLSIPGAFLAAAIFAVHPVNVESAAWIAQRKNMMTLLFFLFSILWYLRCLESAPRPTFGRCPVAAKQPATQHSASSLSSLILHPSSFIPWYCLSLSAFVLAMLGKGSAAVLPVLLLGIVWWLRPLILRDFLNIAPFFAVAAALTGVNIWFQTHGTEEITRSVDFIGRLLGAGAVVWFYIYKAFLPVDLAFIYPQWQIKDANPLWWLPLAAALALTAVLVAYRKSWSRPMLFAWGFFCVALAPVMGFADVGFMKHSLVADHYQHIAIIGVIALAASFWSIWQKQKNAGKHPAASLMVAVAAVACLTLLSFRQSAIYCDSIHLYTTALEKNPESWLAHNNLGYSMISEGWYQEAIDHLHRALTLNFNYARAHYNLGNALFKIGQVKESKEEFLLALKFDPDYAEAHYNLGNALYREGKTIEAIEHYEHALRSKPDFASAHNNLGAALAAVGRLPEAIEHYNKALSLEPEYAEAHNNLGYALYKMERLPEAIEHYEQAVRIWPDYEAAYSNLVAACAKTGRTAEAIAAAHKAIEIARSKGHAAAAEEIENWLKSYRAAGRP